VNCALPLSLRAKLTGNLCGATHIDGCGSASIVALVTAIQLKRRRCFLLRQAVVLFAVAGQLAASAQLAPDVVWTRQTHNYFVSPVAISPDGVLVASAGTNNSIRLANLTDGSAVRNLPGHTDGVASIAFSPDGSLLASTADDRTLRLWEVSTGSLLRTIPQGGGNRQFTSVAFHPDGQHVAADRHRTNVVLWRVSDGMPVWESPGSAAQIESIAFSPDGSLVAAAGGYRGLDTKIRVLIATNGQLLRSLVTSNSYGVRQLAFSPDGQWLAAGCYESDYFQGGVEIWRVSNWTQYRRLPVTAPTLAFLPGGNSLVTLCDSRMEFWSISDGTRLQSYRVPPSGVYGRHQSVAVAPRGDRIVTGNYKHIPTPNGTVAEASTTAIRLPMILSISTQHENAAKLSWTGGFPRYQVQRRSFDSPNWLNIGEPTADRGITLPTDGSGAIFRVVGVAQ